MRVAIIGVGRMGRRHIEIARNAGLELVGLVDERESQAREACREFGLPSELAYPSVDALLSATRPDALVVASTAPSHCELVCRGALAGARYILCEKPMAVSWAEAERMLRVCNEQGVRLAVNHQMQFMPQYTEVKRLVDAPDFGGLTSVIVCGSNFGLAMNGSHYFEMFRYMTGEPVAEVTAWLDADRVPNPRGAQFEDRAGRIRAVTSGGRSLFMDIAAAAGHGLQVVYICRYGQIVVDELSGYVRLVHREAQYRQLPTTRYGMPAVERTFRIEPADVIKPTEAVWRAALSGAAYPDGEAGLHAVRCLLAAHTSDENGHSPVRLDDERIDRHRRFAWA